ncbi:MAG TPA: UDP-N-acetylmuramate:L-alanyl-gamma-D-glutamyl-meso-diaminopimelate ligase, partial [Steroidobacteraceae bacterium]|nr:UDP-N-acetylmuramate:L-alanyl-gamma-D-glutamyl-meso-diaminopimelate ligase [Steroidobacteraceae bacterium]
DPFFVIEADEYDTAFFDKRAKFVHYRPRTLILNNLEYDHADIYPDLASIQRQFHHLVRIVPGGGRIVWNAADANLRATLAMGCWTPREGFARARGPEVLWSAAAAPGADFSRFEVFEGQRSQGMLEWQLLGAHNMENALAAIAAARHAGVPVPQALAALRSFQGIARRMQLAGEVRGVRVYDDFAHHPTAITTTLDGLRRRVGRARIIAVLEPRSHTMRMGVHRDTLAPALAGADQVWLYAPADLGWDVGAVAQALGERAQVRADVAALARDIAQASRSGDHVLIMSNGGFGGLHGKLLAALGRRT